MPEKNEPSKSQPEKIALSAEDLALQKKVQEEMLTSRNILEKEWGEAIKEGDKSKQKWVDKKLRDFELYPYGYIQNILERKLELLEGDLNNPENKKFKKEIDLRIAKVKTRLDNLLDSYEKKIPLKLPHNDRTRNFRPDEGLVFDSENAVYILNKYLKENAKSYTVGDAFQKGPAQYVILKTDSGVEKEINISKLGEILSEASFRDDRDKKMKEEKLEKFEKIKSGTIVQIRVGGFNGKEITYKVHEVKNGEVMYEDLTEKQKVTVSIDDMRKFLMGKGVEFIVGNDRNTNTSKHKDEIKQLDSKTYENLSPNLLRVTEMAKELGFMNALVIHRDLKLSKEEAEKLFNEYKSLENPPVAVAEASEPATPPVATVVETTEPEPAVIEPAKTDDAVTQEPAQEKQGPTSEQIAVLERMKSLSLRIAQLEERKAALLKENIEVEEDIDKIKNTYESGDIVYDKDSNPIGIIEFNIYSDKNVRLLDFSDKNKVISEKLYSEFKETADNDVASFFIDK